MVHHIGYIEIGLTDFSLFKLDIHIDYWKTEKKFFTFFFEDNPNKSFCSVCKAKIGNNFRSKCFEVIY